MKILIDTNVIIDILQKREPFFGESYHALRKAIENDVECMISASAVTDIFYMLRKSLGSNLQAKEQIERLAQLIDADARAQAKVPSASAEQAPQRVPFETLLKTPNRYLRDICFFVKE